MAFVISPCVEQCTGCERVREFDEEKFCSAIPIRPINGPAAAAILPPTSKAQATAAAKVNPLKASKRAAKGR